MRVQQQQHSSVRVYASAAHVPFLSYPDSTTDEYLFLFLCLVCTATTRLNSKTTTAVKQLAFSILCQVMAACNTLNQHVALCCLQEVSSVSAVVCIISLYPRHLHCLLRGPW